MLDHRERDCDRDNRYANNFEWPYGPNLRASPSKNNVINRYYGELFSSVV